MGSDHNSICTLLCSHWFSEIGKNREMDIMWNLEELRLSYDCFIALHNLHCPSFNFFICKIGQYSVIHSIFVMLFPEL